MPASIVEPWGEHRADIASLVDKRTLLRFIEMICSQTRWLPDTYVIGCPQLEFDDAAPYAEQQSVVGSRNSLPTGPDREALELCALTMALECVLVATLGISADRLEALRAAVAKTIADPGILADAKACKIHVEPSDAPRIECLVERSSERRSRRRKR